MNRRSLELSEYFNLIFLLINYYKIVCLNIKIKYGWMQKKHLASFKFPQI